MKGGNGMATTGLVLGYANIALTLVGVCLGLLVLTGALAAPACLVPFMNGIEGNFNMIP